jgi:hypothetical protein
MMKPRKDGPRQDEALAVRGPGKMRSRQDDVQAG